MAYKKMLSLFWRRNTVVRLIFIIASLFYVVMFLWLEDKYVPISDPTPTLLTLDQKSIERASRVEVGLHIINFHDFLVQTNQFTLDAIAWFKFHVGQEDLATIEEFTLDNASLLPSGKIIFRYPPIIKVINDDVVVSYHFIATIKSALDYKTFPLGGHRISLQLQHLLVTPYELYYVSKPENFTYGEELTYLLIDWRPIGTSVAVGYRTAVLQQDNPAMELSYPTAVFSIDFDSVGDRELPSLYFPMLVLFFVVFFCLLLDVTDIGRLTYAATAVPILILYRMVINEVSPSVGYATHLDYIFYMLVLLSMLVVLFQAFVVLVIHKTKDHEGHIRESVVRWLELANDITFYGILILLIILTTYSYFR